MRAANKIRTRPGRSQQATSVMNLPTEDRTLPHQAIPSVCKEPPIHQILVVLSQDPDMRAPLQELPPVEKPTEATMERRQESNRDQVRRSRLEDRRLSRRRPVLKGQRTWADLPHQ